MKDELSDEKSSSSNAQRFLDGTQKALIETQLVLERSQTDCRHAQNQIDLQVERLKKLTAEKLLVQRWLQRFDAALGLEKEKPIDL